MAKSQDEELEDVIRKASNPACRRFSFLIKALCALVMVSSMAADVAYLYKQVFSSKLYFMLFCGVMIFRVLLPLCLIVRYQIAKVCGKGNRLTREQAKEADKYGSHAGVEKVFKDYRRKGSVMYTFLPLMFFTGSHRLLSVKNFRLEVIVGLIVDLFSYVIPLFFLIGINNATFSKSLSDV